MSKSSHLARWLILALMLSPTASCEQPQAYTPLPIPTISAIPVPTSLFSAPPNNNIHLAWFYKPPKNGTIDFLSQHFDTFILTKNDEAERDELRQNGVLAPILQYLLFNAIQDPGSCSNSPYQNQVANLTGDFCQISRDHPDWFLTNLNGERIYEDRNAMMDSGNAGWRSFWLERARQSQEQFGWYGVFLDNVEASLDKVTGLGGNLAVYPDDTSYQAAVEGFLQYLYTNFFLPQKRPLVANIIELKDPAVWPRYLQYLDGAMIEDVAVDWYDGYRSVDEWDQQLELVAQAQAMGKWVILVSQGAQFDFDRQQFAFASYLLVNDGRASFRYAHHSEYNMIWFYDNYRIDLGQPLGPRYQEGKIWRRDFANGSVLIDPKKHTATITQNR
jgi:hypothetical protein